MVNRYVYWGIFGCLIVLGITKIALIQMKMVKYSSIISQCSMLIHIFSVFYFALAREAYATTIIFLLLVIKGIMFFKYVRTGY